MQIHLARALISNPHVLVLHKPFMRFSTARMQEAGSEKGMKAAFHLVFVVVQGENGCFCSGFGLRARFKLTWKAAFSLLRDFVKFRGADDISDLGTS